MYLYALSYGIVTLLTMWALGQNSSDILWGRILIWGLVVWGISLAIVSTQKLKPQLLAKNSSIRTLGLPAGLLVGALLALLLFVFKDHNFVKAHFAVTLTWPQILLLLAVTPAFELFFRGLLQPHWGVFGCAFLEALNLGFGSHMLMPFLLVLIFGFLGGILRERFGFLTGLVFRLTWTALVLAAVKFIN